MNRPATHRAPALARRQALLDAAVEVVAERGVGGATHRVIAARAGVPLSTTSYFFASLDDLIIAALRSFAETSIADLQRTAKALASSALTPAEAVDLLVDALVDEPRASTIAQFEIYLEAARRSELQGEVRKILASFERLAVTALATIGAREPKRSARAFVALADGFALQRLGSPRGRRDRAELRDAMLDLLITQLMTDDELHNRRQELMTR